MDPALYSATEYEHYGTYQEKEPSASGYESFQHKHACGVYIALDSKWMSVCIKNTPIFTSELSTFN